MEEEGGSGGEIESNGLKARTVGPVGRYLNITRARGGGTRKRGEGRILERKRGCREKGEDIEGKSGANLRDKVSEAFSKFRSRNGDRRRRCGGTLTTQEGEREGCGGGSKTFHLSSLPLLHAPCETVPLFERVRLRSFCSR